MRKLILLAGCILFLTIASDAQAIPMQTPWDFYVTMSIGRSGGTDFPWAATDPGTQTTQGIEIAMA